MRFPASLLLLALAAGAQPPFVKDFERIGKLKEDIQKTAQDLQEKEEFASKPREEKMLIAFMKGEKKFEGKDLTGKIVVTTCLSKWGDVQQAQPTEAGKRVLALLPEALLKRYAVAIDVPKDRKEVAGLLLDELDSDYLNVRIAAFDSLKKIFRTQTGFLYEPSMNKKDRRDPITSWKNFLKKQK